MLRAVEAAPKLRAVSIVYTRIALSELVSIMEMVGRRLRVFETSLGDQEESPLKRLEVLLVCAAEQNTELGKFLVGGVLGDERRGRGSIPEEEWKEEARRALSRLQFLWTRVPGLAVRTLALDLQHLLRDEE